VLKCPGRTDSHEPRVVKMNRLRENYIEGNSCYFRSRNAFLYEWPSTKLDIKMYRSITFIVAVYGCETWSFSLRKGQTMSYGMGC
jgi:hypothetical protein